MLIFKKEKHARELFLGHLHSVRECLQASESTLENYLAGDLEATQSSAESANHCESEADVKARKIRELLFNGAFLPNIRSDIYRLVEAVDSIAGQGEELSQFIANQTPDIPKEYHQDLLAIFRKSLSCFFELRTALKCYFKPKGKITDLHEHFVLVCRIESDVDTLQATLTRRVFSSELELVEKIHLQRLIEHIGNIADLSEDAADELEFAALKSVL